MKFRKIFKGVMGDYTMGMLFALVSSFAAGALAFSADYFETSRGVDKSYVFFMAGVFFTQSVAIVLYLMFELGEIREDLIYEQKKAAHMRNRGY